MLLLTILVGVALFAKWGAADPIWPSSIDELEDIMFLNTGFRNSGFAAAVTPCGFSAAGPGRITAAEWIRTAFHDMATGNVFQKEGGLDASIMFEVDRSENVGAAFNTSLAFFASYYSTRVSMSDLIALSVYTAVRSCGGPVVTIRAGRIDATVAGPLGVPLPQNPIGVFENEFARVGFTQQEMIQMTACGHTVGGVHAQDFPEILPPGTAPNNYKAIDSTIAVFDNRIAVEWIAGNTTDPMSVGPSVAATQNSDANVFGADNNVTMQELTDPATFATTCSSILQRMIEVVPPDVVFTNPLQPYEVKPTALQLTLLSGGTTISFTGFIRVRTTVRSMSDIASVQLIYLDRNGASSCGSCTISTSAAGTSNGLDDSFAFYSFSSTLPSDSSISSFNVLITLTDSSTELYNNNGTRYLVQDSIMLQSPQSCLNQTPNPNDNGNLTVVAAVRNDRTSLPVALDLTLMVPREGVIVPALQSSSLPMVEGPCVGIYTLYSVSYAMPLNQALTAKFGVSSGTNSSSIADTFKSTADLSSICASLSSSGASCSLSSSSSSLSTSSSSSSTSSSTISSSSSTLLTSSSSSTKATSSSSTSSVTSSSISTSKSSSATTSSATTNSPTPPVQNCSPDNCYRQFKASPAVTPFCETYTTALQTATVGLPPYVSQCQSLPSRISSACSCLVTGSVSPTFSESSSTSKSSTTSSTSTSEISSISSTSSTSSKSSSPTASTSSTSFKSSSSSTVSTTSSTASTTFSTTSSKSLATPSQTAPALKSDIANYTYYGCQTEATNMRALSSSSTASDTMTLEVCGTFCDGYLYWGAEYGRECYCGNSFNAGSTEAPVTDCSMPCAGDSLEYCGAGKRLSVYALNTTIAPPTPTPAIKPTVGPYTYYGCQTEATNMRALSSATTASDSMTLELCESFCTGYTYWGVEYGRECYCGNLFNAGSVSAPASDCSFVCPGNDLEFCGAGSRLSTYVLN